MKKTKRVGTRHELRAAIAEAGKPRAKPKTVKLSLRADRNLGCASAPCLGYYHLVEYASKNSVERINSPSMFEVLQRALGKLPPHGSVFDVEITVRVVEAAKPSKKPCLNPWPGHYCKHTKRAQR
jgi:hypothetical protein